MRNFSELKQKFFSVQTLLSFLLAFAIIYLLIIKMDPAKILAVLKRTVLPVYALAFITYYLAFPLRGLRFRIMLSNNDCTVPTRELTWIVFISWFANCVVPAKLGDVFRAYMVKRRYCHSFVNTVGTIFAERVFDVFILYLLIGGSGLVAFRGKIPYTMLVVFRTGFLILAIILAVLVFMKYTDNCLVDRFPEKVRSFYNKFSSGTLSSFRNNGQIAALTTVIWLLEGTSFYLVTQALGMRLSFTAVVFIGLISALLTALPVTPAGLGIVEAAKVGVLVFFRVDHSIAVSAALLDRLINYWSLLLIGFIIYAGTEQGRLAKGDREDDSIGNHPYVQ